MLFFPFIFLKIALLRTETNGEKAQNSKRLQTSWKSSKVCAICNVVNMNPI